MARQFDSGGCNADLTLNPAEGAQVRITNRARKNFYNQIGTIKEIGWRGSGFHNQWIKIEYNGVTESFCLCEISSP
jgi:hypothetical protein